MEFKLAMTDTPTSAKTASHIFAMPKAPRISTRALTASADDALLSDEAFSVGKMKYETILVPNCLTLRSITLERLKVFQKKGGRVVFLGELPRFIDAVTRCQIRIFPKEKTWLLK